MILTVDLGTTTTKAALWTEAGMVAIGRSRLETEHPAPAWAEQNATSWWDSVVSAVRGLGPVAGVDAIAFSAARRTFVPVTAHGDPLGPAILWSDTRAGSGAVPAKLQWLQANEPERLAACRWVLSPRDLIAWRLGGEVHTDWTLASASGAYGDDGAVLASAAPFVSKLPVPVPSATVVGALLAGPAGDLRLPAGIPVVIGAGDRQCEVLGTGASAGMPMVSWGTTANVSVPVGELPGTPPVGLRVTRGALGGWLLEGGVSAAGSLVEWISTLTGAPVAVLLSEAEGAPPGARGAIALPWLGGARAPWWREDVGAAFLSLGPGHHRGDLVRAAVEGVAFEICRCVEGRGAERLVMAGSGATSALWGDTLAAVTGLPVVCRRSPEAASVGAAMVAAAAVGGLGRLDLDVLNPVIDERPPDHDAVEVYAAVRQASDSAVDALLTGRAIPEPG